MDEAEETRNWKLTQNAVLMVSTFPVFLPYYVQWGISFTFSWLFFPSAHHQRLAHLDRNGSSLIENLWHYMAIGQTDTQAQERTYRGLLCGLAKAAPTFGIHISREKYIILSRDPRSSWDGAMETLIPRFWVKKVS